MTRVVAGNALSDKIVRADVDLRVVDLLDSIRELDATHVAVFDADEFLGLICLQDILLSSPARIFGDLLPENTAQQCVEETSIDDINRVFSETGVDAVPVTSREGHFLGAVTQQGVLGALLQQQERLIEEKQKLLDDRKQTLRALQQARSSLEDRVRERTAQLSEANEALRREMAERKRAEEQSQQHREQLAHVLRVNTLGQMAASMAHEINQPLTAISIFSDVCLAKLKSTADDATSLVPILKEIGKEAHRAGEIIRGLRSLVRKSESRQLPVCLNETVENIVRLFHSEFQINEVDLKLNLGDSIPLVLGDEVQLAQVILNLVRNALDALMESEPSERELNVRTSFVGKQGIELVVSDRGPQVPAETLCRLFDTFFTTKSEGLGMGLSICHSIVEAHGGTISVSRNPDRGLAFKLTLPVETEAARVG